MSKTAKRRTKKTIGRSAKKLDWKAVQEDIWPQEREVFFRPERLRYVRKLIKSDGCVFCKAREKGVSLKSLCVYKNQHAMLILNKFPYNSGHVMVLPSRHVGDLCDLTDTEHIEIQRLLKKTVEIIKSEYEVVGINIGLNMGKIAGAGIPDHLHWHIIPRWFGDTNFVPLIADIKVVAQTLDQVYAKLVKHFK